MENEVTTQSDCDYEAQSKYNEGESSFNFQQNSLSSNEAQETKQDNELSDESRFETKQSKLNCFEENLLSNEKNEVDLLLTSAIVFRGQDEKVFELFKECQSQVDLMKKLNEEVVNRLDTCKTLQTEVQEWESKLINLQRRMMQMIAALPEDNTTSHNEEPSNSFLSEDKLEEVNEDLVKLKLNNECVSPDCSKSPRVAPVCSKSPRPVSGPNISLLTPEEFQNIPKYSRESIKLDQLNEFISILNSNIERKYKLVGCNLSSLSDKDIELRNSLLHVEVRETKGVYYVTPADLKVLGSIKMSKKDFSMINILRLAKRIKENRVGRFLYYEVIT